MNNCSFIGRLTAKPEPRTTSSGTNVCNFSLAIERRFGGSDGEKAVDYIDFVAWKHNADFICKWFDKGMRIAVTGELQTRVYEDKDGKKIKVCEVLVNSVEFADGKRDASNVTPINTTSNAVQNQQPSDDVFNHPIFANDGFVPIGDNEPLPFD